MLKLSKKNTYILALGLVVILIIGTFIYLRIKTRKISYPIVEKYLENPDSIQVQNDSLILPIVYHGNPDLRLVKGAERKERFVNVMLPSIMFAQKKIEIKQKELKKLERKMRHGSLQHEDSIKVDSILTYFKCQDLRQVINNLHLHPVSIILAQAAIESGWGTSRFFLEANNVFGIWSYNSFEDRIAASQMRDDNIIYLRKYDNLYGSVYDYLITVARAPAYKKLREVRMESSDPYELIQYLINYSELREEYVRILGNVIRQNDLTKYDQYKLADIDENDPFWKSL